MHTTLFNLFIIDTRCQQNKSKLAFAIYWRLLPLMILIAVLSISSVSSFVFRF